ncbi:precorrin-6A/cobalt-precorrin-6A reductase, partial [Enterobacter hormaechei]|uniref:precorrin-6A/cobalt-precorrin-6A reductase n=1 Tax=Enterobacter hormaechei TaxID=158836 RepID=UPI001F0B0340
VGVLLSRYQRPEQLSDLRHPLLHVVGDLNEACDASHPYAEVVSQNIVRACASVGVLLSRYQRPEQLSDLRHPLLHVVGDLNEAC